MPVDENLLSEASAAAGRVTELEDRLEGAKSEYRRTVRRLHLAGASYARDCRSARHQPPTRAPDHRGRRRSPVATAAPRRTHSPAGLFRSAGASNDRSASSSQGRACTYATPASWQPSVSRRPAARRRIRRCNPSQPAARLPARSAERHGSRFKPSSPRQLAKSTRLQRSAMSASVSAARSSRSNFASQTPTTPPRSGHRCRPVSTYLTVGAVPAGRRAGYAVPRSSRGCAASGPMSQVSAPCWTWPHSPVRSRSPDQPGGRRTCPTPVDLRRDLSDAP